MGWSRAAGSGPTGLRLTRGGAHTVVWRGPEKQERRRGCPAA